MTIRQRGLALIELLAALAIGALMLLGLTTMIDTTLADTKDQVTALYQSQVVAAATQYVNSNYSTLLTSATATTPVVVTLSQLTNPTSGSPYLAPETAATNAYGQTSCVVILQPASGEINALVVSYGGQAISDGDTPMIAGNSGPGGGYVSQANPTVAQGASWSLSAAALASFQSAPCVTAGGHLASAIFFNGPGQLSTDYLYRNAVPGRPELNTMQTALLFGNGAVATEGAACGTAAAIAFDANNNQLNCANTGVWEPVTSWWKSPVDTYADLPTTDQAGTVRLATDVNRAFAYTGTTWVALAVDQNGNMVVPTNLNVQTGTVTVAKGDVDVTAGNLNVTAGNLTVGNNGTFGNNVTVGYDLFALDGVTADVYAYSPGWSTGAILTPGTACNYTDGTTLPDGEPHILYPTGVIVRDANGVAMSCYSDNTFHYENGGLAP